MAYIRAVSTIGGMLRVKMATISFVYILYISPLGLFSENIFCLKTMTSRQLEKYIK